VILKRFLKPKETKCAATNTVNSALDAVKIELKQKAEEIVGLQKEAAGHSAIKKRLEFLLTQKVQHASELGRDLAISEALRRTEETKVIEIEKECA